MSVLPAPGGAETVSRHARHVKEVGGRTCVENDDEVLILGHLEEFYLVLPRGRNDSFLVALNHSSSRRAVQIMRPLVNEELGSKALALLNPLMENRIAAATKRGDISHSLRVGCEPVPVSSVVVAVATVAIDVAERHILIRYCFTSGLLHGAVRRVRPKGHCLQALRQIWFRDQHIASQGDTLIFHHVLLVPAGGDTFTNAADVWRFWELAINPLAATKRSTMREKPRAVTKEMARSRKKTKEKNDSCRKKRQSAQRNAQLTKQE